jgi:hypothetical protein
MTDDDRPAFAELITAAHAHWRRDVSEFTLNAWWEGCRRYELEDVRSALNAHAADPDKGHLCPMTSDVVRVLHGTVGDRAMLAWSKVLEAMRDVGAYASVTFDDPAIHASIVDIGGWQACCRGSVDELPHLQRRFAESYRTYARKRGQFDFPRQLAGDHAIALAGTKWEDTHTPAPVLIGDPARAERVLLAGAQPAAAAAPGMQALGAHLTLVTRRP